MLGLALLTKATAFVLCLAVALAYAAHLRHAGRLAALRLAQCGGVAFILGGWWWVKNLIAYGTLQPSDEFWLVPRHVEPVVGDWAERFFYLLPLRFWGQFGYLEVSLNRTLVGVGTVLVLGGIVLALIHVAGDGFASSSWCRSSGPWCSPRRSRGATTSRSVGRSPASRADTSSWGWWGWRPSYAAAVERMPGWARRCTPLLAVAFVLVMHLAAVHVIVPGFWGTPGESWVDRLDDLRAFAPVTRAAHQPRARVCGRVDGIARRPVRRHLVERRRPDRTRGARAERRVSMWPLLRRVWDPRSPTAAPEKVP